MLFWGLSRILCLVAAFHENCRRFTPLGTLRLKISSAQHLDSKASAGKKRRDLLVTYLHPVFSFWELNDGMRRYSPGHGVPAVL